MAFSKPLLRAKKTEIPNDQLPKFTNCIAAIDFGTSSVSLAYTTPRCRGHSGEPRVLKLYKTFERIPNAILIHNDASSNCTVVDIGHQAQTTYSNLQPEKMQQFIYFERIKPLLEKDTAINRDTKVTSFTGRKYYLLEVIAFIISYLKGKLLNDALKQEYKCSDFDWVITVPAIWKARARRMMREAAYLAGLTCDNGGITEFTDTSRGTLPRPLEVNPHKLTLALEPEAAAIYAHDYSHGPRPPRYMVVDIGGGTVDITVHDRIDDKIEVIIPPTGRACGGTTVNEDMALLIGYCVNDKNFKTFHKSEVTSKADLNKLCYQDFEEQKKVFGDRDENTAVKEASITLPPSFVQCYGKKKIKAGAANLGIQFDERKSLLHIGYDVLEEKVFQATIYNIIKCVQEALDLVNGEVNFIYLVGGFGGCSFIQRKLTEALDDTIIIVCPQQADLAVTIGAVLWRQAPDIIQSRIADATYGIGVNAIFNNSIHDKHYRYTDEDGDVRCSNVFEVFVLKGEKIGKEVYMATVTPSYHANTSMSCRIYCTMEDGIQYVRDKKGILTVRKIGDLIIDIPNPHNLSKDERKVDIYMNFRGTEIQASAKYWITGEEVNIVCDFLSFQDPHETA